MFSRILHGLVVWVGYHEENILPGWDACVWGLSQPHHEQQGQDENGIEGNDPVLQPKVDSEKLLQEGHFKFKIE